MAGGHVGRADGVGMVEETAELEPCIASDAGVRRTTTTVLLREIVDDPCEVGGEIEGIERNPETVRNPPRVERVRNAAAALVSCPRCRGLALSRRRRPGSRHALPHEDADAVVALLDEQGRGDARIDAAGHGDDDPRRPLDDGSGHGPEWTGTRGAPRPAAAPPSPRNTRAGSPTDEPARHDGPHHEGQPQAEGRRISTCRSRRRDPRDPSPSTPSASRR